MHIASSFLSSFADFLSKLILRFTPCCQRYGILHLYFIFTDLFGGLKRTKIGFVSCQCGDP